MPLWRQLGLPQFDASTDFGEFLKTHTPSQQVNVIVIDQFEELFTQSNAQPRDALFNLLIHLPPFRLTHTHIIATVRADYLPELFALPMLYDTAKRGIDLRAMRVDELREAIQQPLRSMYPDKDKRFQVELVDRLAEDAAEDAAYLPLLQVTLEEIWRKGALTVGSYNNLADAIKQRADKVLAYQDYDAAQPNQPRTPEEQAAILNLCLDLVDVSLDDEPRRDVRRRPKDELMSGTMDRARLIDTLAQARLLSVSTDSSEPTRVEVDLIHETLLSNWTRLRQAIAVRRADLRQRVRFEQRLKDWIEQDRSDDYLLSGVRLAEARELERRDDIAVRPADVRNFLRRSVARADAQHQKELTEARQLAEAEAQRADSERRRAEEQSLAAKRLRRRAYYLMVAFILSLVLTLALGFFWNDAREKQTIASNSLATIEALGVGQGGDARAVAVAAHATAVALSQRSGGPGAIDNSPMTGDFRIAVADIQVIGERATYLDSFADAFYQRLQTELTNLATFQVAIRGPQQTGPVFGVLVDERTLAAQRLAQKIGADAVIYGNIYVSKSGSEFVLEAYVKSPGSTLDLSDLLRSFQPVAIDGTSPSGSLLAAQRLSNQYGAMVMAVVGLAYQQVKRYQEALNAFDQVESFLSEAAQPGLSRAIVLTLQGEAALNLQHSPVALAACQKAAAIDPQYAPTLVCLGEAQVQQGSYQTGIELYLRAFDATDVDERGAIIAVRLGDAYAAVGDNENARHWYSTVLGLETAGSEAYQQYRAKLDALK